MFDAARFRAILAARGLSQSELARRVGVSQASIYRLASGSAYGSKHLHLIARELLTTPAYLNGETDDPDAGAPPPPPQPNVQLVTMQVCWPPEEALAEMFEAQLEAFARLQGAELARELAKRLPRAIARLQGQRLIVETGSDDAAPVDPEDAAISRPAARTVQHT